MTSRYVTSGVTYPPPLTPPPLHLIVFTIPISPESVSIRNFVLTLARDYDFRRYLYPQFFSSPFHFSSRCLYSISVFSQFLLLEVSNHRSDHIKSQERTESETLLRALSPPFRGSFFPDPSRKKKQSKKHFREEPKKQKLNDIGINGIRSNQRTNLKAKKNLACAFAPPPPPLSLSLSLSPPPPKKKKKKKKKQQQATKQKTHKLT